MSKINLKNRKFTTKTTRLICQRIYGRNIVDSSWRSWRQCVDVARFAHWITGDQLIELAAIVWIRRTNKKGSLTREMVAQAEIDVNETLLKAVEALDRGSVLGADTTKLYQDFGVKPPSQSTMYRRVPNFSKKKYYPNEYILKIA